MSKPKIAIFDFACCEGCQLQIVNLEEELLDLLTVVDPVEWREAMSEQSDEYDIALIEGSVTRAEDAERVREIRDRAKIVIALGACATIGGVNKIKNNFELGEVKTEVYGPAAAMPHLDTSTVKALHEVIKVDYEIHGCPINVEELTYAVRCLLAGKDPVIPEHPVCVECKMKENVCRYECGEICLGPLTRAGCDAHCPSNGLWCFGCRGYAPGANTQAAMEVMAEHGKTPEDLQSRMVLFGTGQEIAR